MRTYCDYCCNATVEHKLTPYNDLSYATVGRTANGYALHLRSGDNRPTALVFSKYESLLERNVDIGIYEMKYCPECGRKLIENEK